MAHCFDARFGLADRIRILPNRKIMNSTKMKKNIRGMVETIGCVVAAPSMFVMRMAGQSVMR